MRTLHIPALEEVKIRNESDWRQYSISLNPDSVIKIKQIVAEAENKGS